VSRTAIRRAAPADAGAIAGVHVASWQVAYRGLVRDALLADLSVDRGWRERLGRPDDGASFTLVAERDGELAGFYDRAGFAPDGARQDLAELVAAGVRMRLAL
jgi:hypothetical protein